MQPWHKVLSQSSSRLQEQSLSLGNAIVFHGHVWNKDGVGLLGGKERSDRLEWRIDARLGVSYLFKRLEEKRSEHLWNSLAPKAEAEYQCLFTSLPCNYPYFRLPSNVIVFTR